MRREFSHSDMSFISSPNEDDLKYVCFNKKYDKLIFFAGVGSSAENVFNAFVWYEENNKTHLHTFTSSSQDYRIESTGYYLASEDYFWELLKKHEKDNFFKNVYTRLLHIRLENELPRQNDIKISKNKI